MRVRIGEVGEIGIMVLEVGTKIPEPVTELDEIERVVLERTGS